MSSESPHEHENLGDICASWISGLDCSTRFLVVPSRARERVRESTGKHGKEGRKKKCGDNSKNEPDLVVSAHKAAMVLCK